MYPAPDRLAETEGEEGGVHVMSFPYGAPVWAGGEDSMFMLPITLASSESTTENTHTHTLNYTMVCTRINIPMAIYNIQ